MPVKASTATKRRNPVSKFKSGSSGKRKTPATAMPKQLKPMLATLVDKPFDEPGWIYEVKWDGYRALAFVDKKNVDLRSRNDKSFNEKFYAIYTALTKLGITAVLDGEIIVADENGHANFSNLQNWRSEADGDLRYYVFDLLWVNGESLLDKPLTERR
ncbi:MAG TPA: hypothetical protein VK625_02070, partial [Flavitalea sp.]|nr:hypothetical protein [Flavitalea sp.]